MENSDSGVVFNPKKLPCPYGCMSCKFGGDVCHEGYENQLDCLRNNQMWIG